MQSMVEVVSILRWRAQRTWVVAVSSDPQGADDVIERERKDGKLPSPAHF